MLRKHRPKNKASSSELAFETNPNRFGSETVLHRKLHLASALRRSDDSQARTERAARRVENRCVGQIDKFAAHLEILMFGEVEVFGDAQVDRMQARPTNGAHTTIPECARAGLCENSRIKPLESAAGCCWAVTLAVNTRCG